MEEIAVDEAKDRLSELLIDVQRGEQFTITRHGVAVARLVAAEQAPSEDGSRHHASAASG